MRSRMKAMMKTQTKHGPKGKRVRPSIIKRTVEQTDHDTGKDENRTRTHWRKAHRQYSVYQLSKRGWKWPKTQYDKKEYKTFKT